MKIKDLRPGMLQLCDNSVYRLVVSVSGDHHDVIYFYAVDPHIRTIHYNDLEGSLYLLACPWIVNDFGTT
jgi:hypothetical protein